MTLLSDWSCEFARGSDYDAPEVRGLVLNGVVTGHPTKPDGRRVKTSAVARVDGRRVTTASGTTYELGEHHPGHLQWLQDQGRQYDPEQPIRVAK